MKLTMVEPWSPVISNNCIPTNDILYCNVYIIIWIAQALNIHETFDYQITLIAPCKQQIKPLPKSIFTKLLGVIWRHKAFKE